MNSTTISSAISAATCWSKPRRLGSRYLFSAKGANQDSLGQRPRNSSENKFSSAESAIQLVFAITLGKNALSRAFSAQTRYNPDSWGVAPGWDWGSAVVATLIPGEGLPRAKQPTQRVYG